MNEGNCEFMEGEEETVTDISNKTWNVMHVNLKKEGYREGASSGKESVLQPSFDSGYREGFKSSYAKGVILGVLSVLESEKKTDGMNLTDVKDDLLNDWKCIMCQSMKPDIRDGSVKSALDYIQETANSDINSFIANSGPLLRSYNLKPDVICDKK